LVETLTENWFEVASAVVIAVLAIATFRKRVREFVVELAWFKSVFTDPDEALRDLGPGGDTASRNDLDDATAKILDAIARQGAENAAQGAAPPPDAQAAEEARSAAQAVLAEGTEAEQAALKTIGEGNTADGLDALFEAAEPATDALLTRWRRIARIAYPLNTGRAIDAYEKVVALGSSDPWDSIFLGRLYVQAGDLAKARRTFEQALKDLPANRDRERGILASQLADVDVALGDLSAAESNYQIMHEVMERRANRSPDDFDAQRDLSISHNKIGDVRVAQGDLPGARRASGRATISSSGWRRPTRATRSGSATSPSATTRSAMGGWPRATCPARWRATKRATKSCSR
jgi:tetratricopeptide (TPR) repeat protein